MGQIVRDIERLEQDYTFRQQVDQHVRNAINALALPRTYENRVVLERMVLAVLEDLEKARNADRR